jgi:4-amino-4-deoxy-L-arabinose transferase-like glycosyltransferase
MTVRWTFDNRAIFLSKELKVSAGTMWAIFWAGAASFVPLLFLQYIGEEPFYPIVAQEMWAKKEFIITTLYGQNFGRPGLYSWLILLLTGILGEQNILIAARLITISSTLLIGLTLAWLIRKIFDDRLLAAFAAAVFLSGDVLIYRGWLAYSDPFFSLLTFAAMACLWVATEEGRRDLLVFAAFCLICSFLAKALTGYVFYGVLGLVLLWRHENRRFLLTPSSIFTHLGAVAFPFAWNYGIVGNSVFGHMTHDVLYQMKSADVPNIAGYVALFVKYPFRTIWYLLPTSAIALYCLASRRISSAVLRRNAVLIALLTVAVNILPYWLAPASGTRYLMPLYPLIALLMAYIVLNSGKFIINLCAKTLIGTICVAYVMALVGFPLYEHYVRGSYNHAAQAIIARAGSLPIFATDFTSVGLDIVATLNALRAPKSPITIPPPGFESGFVLTAKPDSSIGQVDMTFALGRNPDGRRTRYLLCRGEACSSASKPSPSKLSF